ncbi:MAG TPA: hypothetical protein VM305_02130 [Candidatus Limnocylindrales bacterium]|nr:hypothetical protein [Candidatus Limnocylindrales bacterium]
MSFAIRSTSTAPIPLEKVQLLGNVGGDDYGVINGREYVIPPTLSDEPGTWAERRGAVVLSVPRYETDNGRRLETGRRFRRGLEVEKGTYARLREEAQEAEARKDRANRPLPVDALANILALRQRLPLYIQPTLGSGDSQPPRAVDAPRVKTNGAFVEGRPRPRGARELVGELQRQGLAFELASSGKLLVGAPRGRLRNDQLEAVAQAERLIVGVLTGQPVRCELDHGKSDAPEAVTIAPINVAVCERCLREREVGA